MPLFGSLSGLAGGQLLIGAYFGDPRFVPEYGVAGVSGEVLRTIALPLMSRIIAICERRVAILRYDGLGQESIEVYRWPLDGG